MRCDEVISYMKHHGWNDEAGIVVSPNGHLFLTWSEALQQCVYMAVRA